MKAMLEGYTCDRCGWEWLPREKGVGPAVCPKCKTRYWNTPPKNKIRAKQHKRGQKRAGVSSSGPVSRLSRERD